MEQQHNSRICMWTGRKYNCRAFQCAIYEGQDVLLDVDDVDLIYLEAGKAFRLREYWQKKLIWRDFTKKLAFVNPGLRQVHIDKKYELFVAYCQNWWDLLYVNAIKGWKDHCRTSVCWIDEVWAVDALRYKNWMEPLKQFDHVILGLSGSIDAISDAIGRPCHYVPAAVDAIRFSPYPQPQTRVIDVYSLGRKWEGVHQALRKMEARKEIFYVYDTFPGADAQPPDHRQHREMLANMAKRSRYFMVGPAKMDDPKGTQGQVEVGYRYYEGLAAGAILIGQAPDCDSFHAMFDWPDPVIDIKRDGSDVEEILSLLSSQPDRLREISRRNASQALLRHDWVYRWRKVLDIAGLIPDPAMERRELRLKELAELAISDV